LIDFRPGSIETVEIIRGTRGQSSVALPGDAIVAARDHGHPVLLD